MKKSFMTRALATGLSLAMAFSLSAATNVTVASAASTPAMISKTFAVRVGGATKTYKATAATLKTYKISKVSVGNTNKATAIVATSKKGIKVTPGTVTGSTVVTVTFKNLKTSKTTSKKYRCAVKAALEDTPDVPVELAMTAEATGVRTLTVKFTRAVDTTTALTVTKGSAATTLSETTWSSDATEATIKTAGKLTEGTYTVSATVEEQTLTADAVVEKNETLTSFALVGETMKAYSEEVTTGASIEYQALNQYGEPMSCSTAKVTVAPGTEDTAAGKQNTPTATKNGKYSVKDIPAMYTIPGSEFSIVIVDSATGVTFNGKAVYGACARAASVETVGLYSTSKSRIQDMTAGDKVSDYKALFTVKDQYGDPYKVSEDDVAQGGSLTAVAASGLTNVKVADSFATSDPTQTVDDVDYFAIPLTNLDTSKTTAVAGDFSITIVNNKLGVIGTPSFTVSDTVVIASIEISADAVYANQPNTLTYNITDTKGNTVTAYNDLKNVQFGNGSANGTVKFEQNKDGSAKLVYTPAALSSDALKSSIESFTVTANDITSSNYIVKTFTFTVLAQRKAVAVVGVSSSVATSTAASGAVLAVNFKDLLIEDQYGSLFTSDELTTDSKLVSAAAVLVTGAGIKTGTTATASAWTVSGTAVATGVAFTTGKVEFIAPATTAALTASYTISVGDNVNEGYTLKVSKVGSSDLANITSLKIESINDGYAVRVTDGAVTAKVANKADHVANSSEEIPVVVTGLVNGKKVIVESSQCDISASVPYLGSPNSAADIKNDKGTIQVLVSTADGPVTLTEQFDVSNAAPVLTTIKKNNASVTTKSAVSNAAVEFKVGSLDKGYDAIDQYGNDATSLIGNQVTYTLNFKSLTAKDGANVTATKGVEYDWVNNGLSTATIKLIPAEGGSEWKLTVTVTAKFGDQEVEYDVACANYS